MTINAFLEKMADPAFQTAFTTATSSEAKAEVLANAGLSLSVEQAEAAWGGQELSDDDLDQVAGGTGGVIRYPPAS